VTSQYWGRNYERVGYGLNLGRVSVDRDLKGRYGNSATLKYASLIDALCYAATCQAVIPGSSPPELLSFDMGHLTPNASRYVAGTVLRPYLLGR
jgi:hypothetical protein